MAGEKDIQTDGLARLETAQSVVTIPPDIFEKLYLQPQMAVKGDLRKTFANPTPVAIAGFLLGLTPLSTNLLGWRGSGGFGAANIGSYFFCGGMLMVLGGVGEYFLGNTFPMVVFLTLGSFFLTFASTLVPDYGAYAAYATDPTNPATGLQSPAFLASFAFFLVGFAILCFIFCIAAARTNALYMVLMILLVPTFSCLAASFWQYAEGNMDAGLKLQHAGGGLGFAISLGGWYLFAAMIFASVDFPIPLPIFDLSTIVPGASDLGRGRGKGSPV
ncbi:Protein alcS [Pseudocercospora fuligena]|uniref:Protein alcS n=1 Tax=Pseudocercospora fuligena TaxID=685502 RepID=A0A8H6RKY0_9PEZI|nr:Protein alcS [Pseudocercospora fuligena]